MLKSVKVVKSSVEDVQKYLGTVIWGQGRSPKTGTFGHKATVDVGYTAPYAIYVHEDLTVFHPNGIAKFLETPANQMAPDLKKQVAAHLAAGIGIEQALVRAGRSLVRVSQELCPVFTGYLRDSAFVRVRSDP